MSTDKDSSAGGLCEQALEGDTKTVGDQAGNDPMTPEAVDIIDSTKHVQLVETLKWLSENYERSDGVCLPRCVLYTHYLDFCKKHDFAPSSAATFGKVIRQKFPKLTTRRLGTRGQSKYHYYGISIQKTSIYYHSVYSGPGLTRFSEKKPKVDGSNKKFSLSSKTGTLLPEYPDAKNLVLPPDVTCDKVETFIVMYRTHSQRLLDVIVSNNFDEIQNFLLHFWQGLPPHLSYLLEYDVITDVIVLCDSVLYKVLNDILIPASIQDIPESLSGEIRLFARNLPVWLEMALDQIPEKIKEKKMKVVRAFVQSLRRQMSFIHLAQISRSVLMSHESITEMLGDLKDVLSSDSFHQLGLTEEDEARSVEILAEFDALMNKQAPLESFIEWIDCVIEKHLLKELESDSVDPAEFNDHASGFLMNWSFITGKLMGEFTVRSVTSFGKFHLLNLMLQEYALLAIETQHEKAVHDGYQRSVQQHMKKTAEMSTKASIRSTNRKSGSGQGHKPKKKRLNSLASQDELPVDAQTGHNVHITNNLGMSPWRPAEVGQDINVRCEVAVDGGGASSSSKPCVQTYPSPAEPYGSDETYAPTYQTGMIHSSYGDVTTTPSEPEIPFEIYPRQHGELHLNEYGTTAASFPPVAPFNYQHSPFPNPMLPAQPHHHSHHPTLPVPTAWNSPNAGALATPGYGMYGTDLPCSSATHATLVGNMPPPPPHHLMPHDRSRVYPNYAYTGEPMAPENHGTRYAGTPRVNPSHSGEGLARSFPLPGDYLSTYRHGPL